MDGWVKLHRKITEWDWYDDANTFRLFIHLVLIANSKNANWRGNEIKRGELITSIEHLAEDLKLTSKQIRLSLEKLKKTQEIGTQRANNATMITICNYDNYQVYDKTEGQTNGKEKDKLRANLGQTEGNKQEGKELKEEKEHKNIFSKPTFEEVKAYCLERNNGIDAQRFLDSNDAKGWVIGKTKTPMKDWRAAVRTWEGNNPKQNINLGVGETINEQGQRIYGNNRVVPNDAPPRPSSQHYWDAKCNNWGIM